MVEGKYKSDQIDWWEKHKHEVLAIKRRKAVLKRRTDQERLEYDRPKKELEEIHQELVKKLNEINNSINSEVFNFQFRGPNFDRFEMILIQKGLFKFKVNWFDFEEYLPLNKFSGFINEKLNEQSYKIYLGGEFFLNENTQHAELNLSILLKNLSDGVTVAVNNSKGIVENTQEILILVSKDTRFIGQLLSKISHLAVLVLSRNVLQKNAFIIDNQDLFKEESCWLHLDETEVRESSSIESNHRCISENKYIEKFVNQPKLNEIENQIYFEKIMTKHLLQNKQKKLEKALKEKENSYDKFITEKKIDIKASEKLLEDLINRKTKIEGEIRNVNEKIEKIKTSREFYVKEAREKFKLIIDQEKIILNKSFNDLKRMKDAENQMLLSNFQEQEMNIRELTEEHQKLDEKIDQFHKKNKVISEEMETQLALNKKLEEKVNKLESEFEEKHFFAKIMEMSSKSNKETACLICSQNRREIVNMPCKHLTVCSKCHYKIVLSLSFKVCLICKNKVERNIRVIFEKL